MAKCNQCGNDYHRPLEIRRDNQSYTFDSFECAIQHLAPTCARCGTRIVGHGLEADTGEIFCCGHCASTANANVRA